VALNLSVVLILYSNLDAPPQFIGVINPRILAVHNQAQGPLRSGDRYLELSPALQLGLDGKRQLISLTRHPSMPKACPAGRST